MPRYFILLAVFLALWFASPAARAGSAAEVMIGTSCSTGNNGIDWDTVDQCNGTVFAHGPLILGAMTDPPYSATTCTSSNAGMVQYTSGTLEACNGTSWIPIDGGMHFISTQTASSSASLQFTNLPTSYNTLFLNCAGLLVSSAHGYLQLLVGEGATPTWETGAHYIVATEFTDVYSGGGGGASVNGGTTSTDLLDWVSAPTASTTQPQTLKAYIDNVGSSSIHKNVYYNFFQEQTPDYYQVMGMSFWSNDTNAVTGLEVTTTGDGGSAGNITSGTCSLYGMN
jgi:hypothetical protein